MIKRINNNILLTAGGTGGHLYGSESLASELSSQDYNTFLFTDDRVESLVKGFEIGNVKKIHSATFTNINFYKWPFVFIKLIFGFLSSLIWINKFKIKTVVGFGGYPTIPVIFAAKLCGLKIIIHEQNMVLGRANKLLIRLTDKLSLGFNDTAGIPDGYKEKIYFSGNPIRSDILKYKSAYRIFEKKNKFKLVIFGGSQGASFFSNTIPLSLSMLSGNKKSNLDIYHQVRPEEVQDIENFYGSENIKAKVSYFFDDLPELLNSSHLIISRSGASTVSEIAAIGRPAILIPLSHSIDGDQKLNALRLMKTGQVLVGDESQANSDWFYKKINKFMNDPSILKDMSNRNIPSIHKDGAKNIMNLIKNFE